MDDPRGRARQAERPAVVRGADREFRGEGILGAEDLAKGSARIRRDFLAGTPPGVLEGILTLRDGQAYSPGTTLPLGVRAYAARPSGVVAPASQTARPAPGDLLRAFANAEEVLGAQLGPDALNGLVATHDLGPTLVGSAEILSRLERRPVDPDRDREMAAWLAPPWRQAAEAAIEQGRPLVFGPALLQVVKVALKRARQPAKATPADARWLLVAALDVQSRLDGGGASQPDVPGVVGASEAVVALIRTQVFNNPPSPVHLLAVSQRRWRDLPARWVGQEDYVDLAAAYRLATGADIDDVVTLCLRLWMLAQAGNLAPSRGDLRRLLPRRRLARALRAVAAPAHELRHAIETEEGTYGPDWTFDAIRRFPVVRLRDGRLVILSSTLVLEKAFSTIRFDLEFGLRERGQPDEAAKAVQFWQTMCERDAIESLEAIAPADGPLKRLYRGDELKAAFPAKTRKARAPELADAAIAYPGTWVVVEVTTTTLNRFATAGGSVESLLKDFEKLAKKARQLDSTIGELRAREASLTRSVAMPLRRFIPVLVMAEGFPINAATTTAFAAHLESRGTLVGPDIAPIHILDRQDLAIVEDLAGRGMSFLDLLLGHEGSEWRRMALADYILMDLGLDPQLPARLQGAFDQAWAPIFDAVSRAERSASPA